ncbi:MAG TPA: phosphatase PAP2 family protein, partial [Acidobacteriota bacterium]|nr:phosphatase PAP2 family protein [Acidobacteriota bacterium]
ASIHANTCPSAHVACTAACAFVLLSLAPPVGLVFLVIAVSISLGAVAGRYHYLADAILGWLVAILGYLAASGLMLLQK